MNTRTSIRYRRVRLVSRHWFVVNAKKRRLIIYRRSRDSYASFMLKHKEPINRVKSRGLLALRLCVWLFVYFDFQLFYAYQRFLFAFRAEQREVF